MPGSFRRALHRVFPVTLILGTPPRLRACERTESQGTDVRPPPPPDGPRRCPTRRDAWGPGALRPAVVGLAPARLAAPGRRPRDGAGSATQRCCSPTPPAPTWPTPESAGGGIRTHTGGHLKAVPPANWATPACCAHTTCQVGAREFGPRIPGFSVPLPGLVEALGGTEASQLLSMTAERPRKSASDVGLPSASGKVNSGAGRRGTTGWGARSRARTIPRSLITLPDQP